MASQWEIFFMPACRHAKPRPKDKFVLIAYVNPSPHGFFINSRINDYILNRPYLLPCEAEIFMNQHPFLTCDSFVDCREIFPFNNDELTSFRGILSHDGQTSVQNAVRTCTVLEQIHKNRIII